VFKQQTWHFDNNRRLEKYKKEIWIMLVFSRTLLSGYLKQFRVWLEAEFLLESETLLCSKIVLNTKKEKRERDDTSKLYQFLPQTEITQVPLHFQGIFTIISHITICSNTHVKYFLCSITQERDFYNQNLTNKRDCGLHLIYIQRCKKFKSKWFLILKKF